MESCKQLNDGVYQCGKHKILRIWIPIVQLKLIQPPCEFVRDAGLAISRSASPEVRSRLCLDASMRGGDLKCLVNEWQTIHNDFERGSATHLGYYDGGPHTDRWLYDALYALPAPIHDHLLPWLQSLPVHSKSPHLLWAKKLAIAAHQKDLTGFLALYRETDAFFSGYISKWAVYYFPQVNWKQEFSKIHFSHPNIAVDFCSPTTGRCGPVRRNRQRYLLENIQGTIKDSRDHPNVLADEIKRSEASYCRANPEAS